MVAAVLEADDRVALQGVDLAPDRQQALAVVGGEAAAARDVGDLRQGAQGLGPVGSAIDGGAGLAGGLEMTVWQRIP